MSSLPVADYVTLFRKDAITYPNRTVVSGILEWDIPSDVYYYHDRGPMAAVSLADASINSDGQGGAQGMTIWYEGALTGGVSTAGTVTSSKVSNNAGCIGIGRYGDQDNEGDRIPSLYHFNQGGAEPIKLLCSARPNKIRLHFHESDKNLFSWGVNTSQDAVFILRFDYLDQSVENQKNDAASYKPAFSF